MKKNTLIFTILFLVLVFIGTSNGQTSELSNSSDDKRQKNDQPLKIKNKPQATFERNCSQSSGVVSVRVTFDKSAKITDAEIISSSGCDSFDRNAIKAAKRIKFNPAIKNGEPVTVSKLVEYTFRKY